MAEEGGDRTRRSRNRPPHPARRIEDRRREQKEARTDRRVRADGSADETDSDAGASPGREAEGSARAEPTTRAERDDERSGFSFTLPPMTLPRMELPERIRLLFPLPEPPERSYPTLRVRVSHVLLVALLVDLLDAATVLWVGGEPFWWARGAVGLAVSLAVAGPAGLLYGWESLATLGGFGLLALAPTATLLVLVRAVFAE
ncbi:MULTISPECIES: hypothetical protein [Halorussus]|uniref:hypothetical protein n=1 Tax=Halorussus TaxID=1070314 RepID=UPI0020A181B1|nr:hypothetical protein [Halorussus vallis]USZ77532.1 hypothetical protein NGM07_09390 [Halorussus vallis]